MARIRVFAAFLLAAVCLGASGLPQGTGSQSFQAWEGFGVGSSATLESTAENPRGLLASTSVQKLIEKADDHLVLEVAATVVMSGKTDSIPPSKITVQAAPDPSIGVTQTGSEDVAAAGKTFSCKVLTVTNSVAGPNVKLKIWTSKEVPGGIVKLEMDGPSLKIRSMLKSLDVK